MLRPFVGGFVAIALIAAAHANEPFDLTSVVVDPDGKPVAGADVWLVPFMSDGSTIAHVKSGEHGRFLFPKELIGKLRDARTYSQVIVRDAQGRLGYIYMISEFLNASPPTVKLAERHEVRGRIIGPDGNPVAGASVAVRSFEVDYKKNLRLPIRLPAELLGQYRSESDAQGNFVIRDVLPKARVIADVSFGQHPPITVNWDATGPLELKLPQSAFVAGRFTGPLDTNPVGRRLTLKTDASQSRRGAVQPVMITFTQTQTVGPNGNFQFASVPPGPCVLESPETEVGPIYFEAQKVEVKAGEKLLGLELPLKSARRLRGQVVDAKNAGVPGVSVDLCRFVDQGGPFGRQLQARDCKAITGPDGWYEGHVVPGRLVGVQIRQLPDGYARNEGSDVEASSDPSAPMPPIHVYKAEPIIVRVVDASGKPVTGAKVDFSGESAYVPAGTRRTTNSKGELRLPFSDRSESILLRATADDAVSEPRTIDPAKVREPIELTVDSANAFRFIGQVVDQAGRPVAEAPVGIMRSVSYSSKKQPGVAGSGGSYVTLHTDADGRFASSPLVAGDRYTGTIEMPDFQPTATVQVEAVKGRTHDFGRIVLKRTSAVVRGRVMDSTGRALAGARVVNSGDAPRTLSTHTDAAGNFELKGLMAGRVYVVAFHDGFLPAWAAADTERPDRVTLTLRRRGEAVLPQPLGIDDAAVRALAKRVLEKLWEWPEARKSPVDKKVIGLMARLDPALARQWAGKPADGAEEPSIDKLVEDDLDEALAQLAARDSDAACLELKRLAEKYRHSDKAKSLRLVEELSIRARAVDPSFRPLRLADAGRLMAQLGRADAGRKLIEEVAAHVEKLPADGWEAYVRGYVAGRLAPFDLPRARKLVESAPVKRDRDRYAAMCANALAPTDPKAALEMLDSIEPGNQRAQFAATVAFVTAQTDPEGAARIAEVYGEGGALTASGLAGAAWATAPRDKAKAHELLDRAFRTIHQRKPHALGFSASGVWAEVTAEVAAIAVRIDHPERSAIAAHIFAERPTLQDARDEAYVIEANVGLALILAPLDFAAARTLLDIAEARKDLIAARGALFRRGNYLAAVGFIEPRRAEGLLTAEIDRIKALGQGLPEHCDLLKALEHLTVPPSQRLKSIARSLGIDWDREVE